MATKNGEIVISLLVIEVKGRQKNDITREITIFNKAAQTIATALQHTFYKDSYYTLQKQIEALEECTEGRGDIIEQLRPCQCVAHLVLGDRTSSLRPYITVNNAIQRG